MSTLDEMLAKRTPESRMRVEKRTEEIRRELTLATLREELAISQTQLAISWVSGSLRWQKWSG